MVVGLDERHHTYIQALMRRGPLDEKHAKTMFTNLFQSREEGAPSFLCSVTHLLCSSSLCSPLLFPMVSVNCHSGFNPWTLHSLFQTKSSEVLLHPPTTAEWVLLVNRCFDSLLLTVIWFSPQLKRWLWSFFVGVFFCRWVFWLLRSGEQGAWLCANGDQR